MCHRACQCDQRQDAVSGAPGARRLVTQPLNRPRGNQRDSGNRRRLRVPPPSGQTTYGSDSRSCAAANRARGKQRNLKSTAPPPARLRRSRGSSRRPPGQGLTRGPRRSHRSGGKGDPTASTPQHGLPKGTGTSLGGEGEPSPRRCRSPATPRRPPAAPTCTQSV